MSFSRLPILAGCLLLVVGAISPALAADDASPATAKPDWSAASPANTKDAEPAPVDKKRERFAVDRKIVQARQLVVKGEWAKAQDAMLEAATQLRKLGYENDQASLLREMTLEPVEGKPAAAQQYIDAGKRGLAQFYYQRYLAVKPRDAQWLLEALAWANYARAEDLVTRFSARVPDKAHENIDERARQHARALEMDDALYLAYERMRFDVKGTAAPELKKWPYPVDQVHTQLGTSLLHMAVWYNRSASVRVLIEEMKANVNVEDKEKDTPLDYALHLGNASLAAYLTSSGGKANRKHDKPAGTTNAPEAGKKP